MFKFSCNFLMTNCYAFLMNLTTLTFVLSTESEEELAGSSFESESDLESLGGSTSSLSPETPRKCPLSYMRPLPEEEDVDEKKYYGILMKNIKLWKYSQESVSSLCGSDSSWYYLEGESGKLNASCEGTIWNPVSQRSPPQRKMFIMNLLTWYCSISEDWFVYGGKYFTEYASYLLTWYCSI